jgi:hypothetical protein
MFSPLAKRKMTLLDDGKFMWLGVLEMIKRTTMRSNMLRKQTCCRPTAKGRN